MSYYIIVFNKSRSMQYLEAALDFTRLKVLLLVFLHNKLPLSKIPETVFFTVSNNFFNIFSPFWMWVECYVLRTNIEGHPPFEKRHALWYYDQCKLRTILGKTILRSTLYASRRQCRNCIVKYYHWKLYLIQYKFDVFW